MKLFLLFFGFPLLETWLLFKFSNEFGFLVTLTLIILTAAVGSRLAKSQGLQVYKKLQEELQQGKQPSQTIIEGVLILISGVVLLLPGLVSDCIGILLLIPPIRIAIAQKLPQKLSSQNFRFQFGNKASFQHNFTNTSRPPQKRQVEEAEYEVIDKE